MLVSLALAAAWEVTPDNVGVLEGLWAATEFQL